MPQNMQPSKPAVPAEGATWSDDVLVRSHLLELQRVLDDLVVASEVEPEALQRLCREFGGSISTGLARVGALLGSSGTQH